MTISCEQPANPPHTWMCRMENGEKNDRKKPIVYHKANNFRYHALINTSGGERQEHKKRVEAVNSHPRRPETEERMPISFS